MAERRTGGQAYSEEAPDRRKAQGRRKSPGKKHIGNCDYSLIFMVVFLVLFGLVMMYSATLYTETYFSRQFAFAFAGIVIMLIVSRIDYHYYKFFATAILVIGVITVLLVLTPLAVGINGASRWIQIGPIRFQPAEIFKVSAIIFNASVLNKFGKKIKQASYTCLFIGISLVEGLFVCLVTKNISTGIIVGAIGIAMLFVAGPNMKVFLLCTIGVALVVTGVILYARALEQSGTDIYWMKRILKWLYPEKYNINGENLQTQQSLYAVGTGGFWGKGLGNSTQKLVLPEAMNDMVFAIICEELGFVGASFVCVLYIILLQRLVFIVRNAKDRFGSFLALGILSHIAIQVILNIAVVTNVIPSTGITLPFISYGGTALVILLVEMGVALNVSRHIELA